MIDESAGPWSPEKILDVKIPKLTAQLFVARSAVLISLLRSRGIKRRSAVERAIDCNKFYGRHISATLHDLTLYSEYPSLRYACIAHVKISNAGVPLPPIFAGSIVEKYTLGTEILTNIISQGNPIVVAYRLFYMRTEANTHAFVDSSVIIPISPALSTAGDTS